MKLAISARSRFLVGASALFAAMSLVAPAAAAPNPGETLVYRLVNGYNGEVRGRIEYQVEQVGADRIVFNVNPDNAEGGVARTEVYTKDGNWLRRPVESHGNAVEYDFAAPYPAYVFPLDARKSWSTRIPASVPGTVDRRSVRVDGRVLGMERIRVPAGEFDAIKVRRYVYPGDAVDWLTETRIVEVDWYVPALGYPVRTERHSAWLDMSRCAKAGCDFYGNWDVLELESRPAK